MTKTVRERLLNKLNTQKHLNNRVGDKYLWMRLFLSYDLWFNSLLMFSVRDKFCEEPFTEVEVSVKVKPTSWQTDTAQLCLNMELIVKWEMADMYLFDGVLF